MIKTQRQQLIFCISDPQEKKRHIVNLDAGWTKAACTQLFQGNLRWKQIETLIRDTSPSGRVVGERAANRIMSCMFTFTKQTEGLDRYVTNVIRESYHPSSCAFNETPLTMWPWSSSNFSPLQALQRANSESTIYPWNGICLISSDVSQFENLNP